MYEANINLIQKRLFLSFVFLAPISQKLSTINIGLLLIVSILNFQREKFNLLKGFLFPIGLYLLYCFSLLYSSEFQFGIAEQKASLFVFPIIFMLNKNVKEYFNLILKFFVFGCLFALIICELNALYSSINFNHLTLIFEPKTNSNNTFYNSILKSENRFFSYNFSFLHQTVYFSMYLLFSIAILFQKKLFKIKFIQKGILLILCIGIFQILNKASLIAFLFIIILKVYSYFKNKKIAIVSILMLFIIATSLFVISPRYKGFNKNFTINKSEIETKDYKKINNKNPNRTNFRVMLWSSAIELIQQNPIMGIGAGGSHKRLYEVFAVKRQWYDKNEKYHTHNQYLQVFLDLGIIGFFTFFLMFTFFLKNIKKVNNNKDKILIINFLVIVGINFLFESVFERYSGISFYCFFYCLLVCYIKPSLQQKNKYLFYNKHF